MPTSESRVDMWGCEELFRRQSWLNFLIAGDNSESHIAVLQF